MSVTSVLLLTRPERYRLARELFEAAEPARTWLEGVYSRLDGDFDTYWQSVEEEEPSDTESWHMLLNGAFVDLIEAERVELYCWLGELVRPVARRVAEARPLARLIESPYSHDVELPKTVWPVESGLIGVWSPLVLREPYQRVACFAERETVEAFFASRSYGLLDRVRGARRRDAALRTEWLEEGFWQDWTDLLDALRRSTEHELLLGLEQWF